MARRTGLSLTEVLVALFLVAIGVLGVLTLFPVGAVQMGQAFRDQRVAECAANADAYMRWVWRHEVVDKERAAPSPGPPAVGPGTGDPFFRAMDNPNNPADNGGNNHAGVTAVPTTSRSPSFPVAVDPMGTVARGSTAPERFWVGDTGNTDTPRRTVSLIAGVGNQQLFSLRTCTLMDGLGYDEDGRGGVVDTTVTPPITVVPPQRENRYNWMWVVQRPVNRDRYTANLTVVVFDRRVHMYVPDKAEDVYTGVSFKVGSTSVQIPKTGGVLPVQKGNWVMDASNVATGVGPVRHAKFYRVVSATDTDPSSQTAPVDVELHTPIIRVDGRTNPPTGAPTANYTGTLVVMPAVAEVFERDQLVAR